MRANAPPNHLIPRSGAFAHEMLARIAARFGTPVFVYDASLLSDAMRELRSALPARATILYSMKANPSVAIVEHFASLGAGFEIASLGELHTLLSAGADPRRAVFVGPGKRDDDIRAAVVHGLGTLVAESPAEVRRASRIARQVGVRLPVLLRVNPGLPPRGASGEAPGLAMGGRTQFGMSYDEALSVLRSGVRELDGVEIVGVHGYLGTRILDYRTVVANTSLLLDNAAALQRATGRQFLTVDVGGGFGVACYQGEEQLDVQTLRRELDRVVESYVHVHPWTRTVAFESGRFLTARAGVFLCSVVDVKEREGVRFVILDGGGGSIGGRDGYVGARPMPVEVLAPAGSEEVLSLCGPLCTPTDRVAANVVLPLPTVGGLVAFHLAGAYSLTASSGLFLSHGFVAEVLVCDGEAFLARERQDATSLTTGQHRRGGRT